MIGVMGEITAESLSKIRRISFLIDRWTMSSMLLAGFVALPVLTVLALAFGSTSDIWQHLLSTSLPHYLRNTLYLMVGVGVAVCLLGISTAWLVTMCRFPGRKVFEWLLLLPLAMPAYVIAYAYTDFL